MKESESNQAHDDPQPPVHESIEVLAKMAVALLGLSYVCGFIVLYTFFRRFGIVDSSTELLRIRYAYSGILCLAFPLFLLAPAGAHAWMIRAQHHVEKPVPESDESVGQSRLSHFIQLLCVGGCLYWFVLFEPHGAFQRRLLPLTLLLIFTVLPPSISAKHLGFAATKEHDLIRWLFAVASLGFTIWAIWGDFGHIRTVLVRGRAYFLLVIILLPYFIHSTSVRVRYWFEGQRTGVLVARSAMALTLSLLSTLAFAYRVFPSIPADKGGGNFDQSRVARLCIGSFDQTAVPAELFSDSDMPRCSVPVAIIDSTDSFAWVSRMDDWGGAVDDGQRCAPEIWSEGQFYPRIFEINRTKVSHIEYQRAPVKGDRVRVLGRNAEVFDVLNTSDHDSRLDVRLVGSKAPDRVCRASATVLTDDQVRLPLAGPQFSPQN